MIYNHPTRAFASEPEYAREYDDYYADLDPAESSSDFLDDLWEGYQCEDENCECESEAQHIAEDAAMEAGLFGWDA